MIRDIECLKNLISDLEKNGTLENLDVLVKLEDLLAKIIGQNMKRGTEKFLKELDGETQMPPSMTTDGETDLFFNLSLKGNSEVTIFADLIITVKIGDRVLLTDPDSNERYLG
jgi:hypothetical protein